MIEPCEHQQRNPEGTEWPDSDSLAHFLYCKTEQEQADWWAINRELVNAGYSCQMGNHQSVIKSQAKYTQRLLSGIRGLIEQLGPEAFVAKLERDTIRQRLQELIS